MAVIINGTTGVAVPLGTAAAPGVVNTTSATTGIYNPTSTTLGLSTNGTNAVTIDASQNVGIGLTAPAYNLHVRNGAGNAYVATQYGTGTIGYMLAASNEVQFKAFNGTNDVMTFATGASERMRIDSSGNLLVGATAAAANERLRVEGSVANSLVRFVNTNASPFGPLVQYGSGVDPNGTGNDFISCYANLSTQRFSVRSNGGIANFSANNVNLSDERVKKDIQLAGSYLNKICAIPVKTFLYKDQTDNDLNLGVIAQDVEAIAPELISNDGFGTTPEDGVPYKTIYQTDLQYALMKCIQELSAEVEALKAKVGA